MIKLTKSILSLELLLFLIIFTACNSAKITQGPTFCEMDRNFFLQEFTQNLTCYQVNPQKVGESEVLDGKFHSITFNIGNESNPTELELWTKEGQSIVNVVYIKGQNTDPNFKKYCEEASKLMDPNFNCSYLDEIGMGTLNDLDDRTINQNGMEYNLTNVGGMYVFYVEPVSSFR